MFINLGGRVILLVNCTASKTETFLVFFLVILCYISYSYGICEA